MVKATAGRRGKEGSAGVMGVIPARWGSTRLPGKSLVPIAGKPLLQHVVERVQQASALDRLVVATDDERIRRAADTWGVEAVMTRSDHPSGTDRVAEAVADSAARWVVNIQGDEPLIDPGLVDRLAVALRGDERWDMATAAARLTSTRDLRETSVVKVVMDADRRALYFSRFAIPFVRDAEAAGEGAVHWQHIGLYGYRREFLERLVAAPPCMLERAERLEQLRALHMGGRILVIEAEEAGIGVDTPQDVAYVEGFLGRGEERA